MLAAFVYLNENQKPQANANQVRLKHRFQRTGSGPSPPGGFQQHGGFQQQQQQFNSFTNSGPGTNSTGSSFNNGGGSFNNNQGPQQTPFLNSFLQDAANGVAGGWGGNNEPNAKRQKVDPQGNVWGNAPGMSPTGQNNQAGIWTGPPPPAPAPAAPAAPDPAKQLEQLKMLLDMRDQGKITEAEYNDWYKKLLTSS